MKIENNIGWCDATTNAVIGCDKVSPGCKNCYAEAGTRARVLRAQGRETWGPKGERVPVNFEPVFRRLNKLCVCDKCHEGFKLLGEIAVSNVDHARTCGGDVRRPRLFADSNSDWLDPKWPVETLARFLDAIRLAPNVDVLLLTKRIELFKQRMAFALGDAKELRWGAQLVSWLEKWLAGTPPPNLWLGISVEDNLRCIRIPILRGTPAAVRFISFEPLLEDLPKLTLDGIGWAIVGGESGKNRRDCGVAAIESVVAQCAAAGVPVYCKQDSAMLPGQRGRLSEQAWSRKEFP